MDKKLLAFYYVAVIVLVFMAVFLVRFYIPDFKPSRGIPYQPTKIAASSDYGPHYAPELNFFAGACALLLVGHLFWAFIGSIKKTTRSAAMQWRVYCMPFP